MVQRFALSFKNRGPVKMKANTLKLVTMSNTMFSNKEKHTSTKLGSNVVSIHAKAPLLNQFKINQRRILIDSLEIGIPAPEQILTLGERQLPNGVKVGQLLNSKTLNYKKFTPHRDGLFCERIFGPIQSFICACGKKKENIQNKKDKQVQTNVETLFCSKCEVEYITKTARRHRLGYIKLFSPVTHIWYLKGRPSYLSLFLGKRKKAMTSLAYCNAYLVEQTYPESFVETKKCIPNHALTVLTHDKRFRQKTQLYCREKISAPYTRKKYDTFSPTCRTLTPAISFSRFFLDLAKTSIVKETSRGQRFWLTKSLFWYRLKALFVDSSKSFVSQNKDSFTSTLFLQQSKPSFSTHHDQCNDQSQEIVTPMNSFGKGEKQNQNFVSVISKNDLRQSAAPIDSILERRSLQNRVLHREERRSNQALQKRSFDMLRQIAVANASLRLLHSLQKRSFCTTRVSVNQSAIGSSVKWLYSPDPVLFCARASVINKQTSSLIEPVKAPLLYEGAKLRQLGSSQPYIRAQTLPFLPSLICSFYLRDCLISFLQSLPCKEDIPIPLYCQSARRYPLRDVHKFLAECRSTKETNQAEKLTSQSIAKFIDSSTPLSENSKLISLSDSSIEFQRSDKNSVDLLSAKHGFVRNAVPSVYTKQSCYKKHELLHAKPKVMQNLRFDVQNLQFCKQARINSAFVCSGNLYTQTFVCATKFQQTSLEKSSSKVFINGRNTRSHNTNRITIRNSRHKLSLLKDSQDLQRQNLSKQNLRLYSCKQKLSWIKSRTLLIQKRSQKIVPFKKDYGIKNLVSFTNNSFYQKRRKGLPPYLSQRVLEIVPTQKRADKVYSFSQVGAELQELLRGGFKKTIKTEFVYKSQATVNSTVFGGVVRKQNKDKDFVPIVRNPFLIWSPTSYKPKRVGYLGQVEVKRNGNEMPKMFSYSDKIKVDRILLQSQNWKPGLDSINDTKCASSVSSNSKVLQSFVLHEQLCYPDNDRDDRGTMVYLNKGSSITQIRILSAKSLLQYTYLNLSPDLSFFKSGSNTNTIFSIYKKEKRVEWITITDILLTMFSHFLTGKSLQNRRLCKTVNFASTTYDSDFDPEVNKKYERRKSQISTGFISSLLPDSTICSCIFLQTFKQIEGQVRRASLGFDPPLKRCTVSDKSYAFDVKATTLLRAKPKVLQGTEFRHWQARVTKMQASWLNTGASPFSNRIIPPSINNLHLQHFLLWSTSSAIRNKFVPLLTPGPVGRTFGASRRSTIKRSSKRTALLQYPHKGVHATLTRLLPCETPFPLLWSKSPCKNEVVVKPKVMPDYSSDKRTKASRGKTGFCKTKIHGSSFLQAQAFALLRQSDSLSPKIDLISPSFLPAKKRVSNPHKSTLEDTNLITREQGNQRILARVGPETISKWHINGAKEILSYTGGGALEALLKRFNTQQFCQFLFGEIQLLQRYYKDQILVEYNKVQSLGEHTKHFSIKDRAFRLSRTNTNKGASLFCRRIYRTTRRLKIVQLLMRNKRRPEWMMISVLPVLPPDLRPVLQMGENLIVASDLNTLYQRVIYRNNRHYKGRFLDFHFVSSIHRLVQDAVDRLIENGKGGSTPFSTPGGRPLKSLSDILKGKRGRFRFNLLGKRVDFSGRSVIVVSPNLKIHECGLPREMALELYKYLLIRQLFLQKRVSSIVNAKKLIKQRKPFIWDILREIIYYNPILLNRAPTLHRLGIQAFQPKLTLGNAILLHPLVCAGFNADFDGDQMGVHLPLSPQARAEAWDLLWSRNNLLSPATGQPILLPSQDMVLGFYYMTSLLPYGTFFRSSSKSLATAKSMLLYQGNDKDLRKQKASRSIYRRTLKRLPKQSSGLTQQSLNHETKFLEEQNCNESNEVVHAKQSFAKTRSVVFSNLLKYKAENRLITKPNVLFKLKQIALQTRLAYFLLYPQYTYHKAEAKKGRSEIRSISLRLLSFESLVQNKSSMRYLDYNHSISSQNITVPTLKKSAYDCINSQYKSRYTINKNSLDAKTNAKSSETKIHRSSLLPVPIFANISKAINAYQKEQIDIHTPIWIKWSGQSENGEKSHVPLEVRINMFGYNTQIYSTHKYQSKICQKEQASFLNLYMRTTAGRILVNNLLAK